MRFRPLQLRARWSRGVKDLEHLRARFRGEIRPPWMAHTTKKPSTIQSQPTLQLKVTSLVQETADAVSIGFEAYESSPALDGFRPGQFLTLELTLDGERLRRAYSLANAKGAPPFITVKRIPGGVASTYLTTGLHVGDILEARGPSGSFGLLEKAPAYAVLVAGGSGITPVLSIGETLLRTTEANVLLCYGNRTEQDVIFAKRLSALRREFLGRFVVEHQLEDKATNGNREGWLDGAALSRLLSRHSPPADAVYFVCGPAPMMQSTLSELESRGATHVQSEAFATLVKAKTVNAETDAAGYAVKVALEGANNGHTLQVEGETILEAAMAQGVALPFSCAMGGCGACLVKLEQGEVVMDEPNCLTEDEKEDGLILTCCARPLSDCVISTEALE